MLNPAAHLPQYHPISVREYFRMGETGVLDPEARCELIEGELFDMPPIGPPYSSKVKRLNRFFSRIIGDRAIVSAQDPILLGDLSAPQPDLALLRWREDFYEQLHPGPEDILVLVEVADSTLTYDRDRKLPLYARFAIPEVWLVDVAGRQLDVYRDPENGKYKTKFRVQVRTCYGFRHIAQIINGCLVTYSRPTPKHLRAGSSLGGALDGPFRQGPCWTRGMVDLG